MFNNLNHRFGEKGKSAAALLAAAVLLCGLTGCSKSETDSSAPDSAASVPQSTSVTETKDSQSSEVNSDNSGSSDAQNEQNATPLIKPEIKPEIVMDGQLITIPCKVKDIEGIMIDREYSFAVVPASENVEEYSTSYFYYNGIRAGGIRLAGDCSKKADLSEETVVGIDLFDEIPISCLGLTLQSNREDIIGILGNPDINSDYLLIYYIDGDPANHIDFSLKSNGKIDAVRIFLGIA